ncbi:lysophospholipid acyltransferase family protein [Fibrella sp. HMF5335]|uniref:Lysophospholipid acyltransferase family protein n=1 Tax=Fibrella rubiginis TaxID=2817060 RepID=A0A939GJF6_9BACT|nr:lysophospholipid acyltransferase family protein [Fibrella rubiginis]MBO0938369.1 lysophospholipid acyltransferase family protein [Fibrella rubiginis]
MIAFRVLASLPFFILYRVADILYLLLTYLVRYRRAVILDNLRHSFPTLTEPERWDIAKAYYRNISDILVETIKLPGLSADELRRRVVYTNPEVAMDLLERGQAVVGLAAHQCNWEWLPSAASLYGMRVDSVYKPLNSPFSERLMQRIRSSFGPYLIPMQRLPRELVLRRNIPRLIALVADQMPNQPESAYWIDFLHRDTPFYTGAERLARNLKLPVLYAEMVRVKRGYYQATFTLLAEPPYDTLPEGQLIERYRDELTNTIQRNPANWLWSHKRWKHQREKYAKLWGKLE